MRRLTIIQMRSLLHDAPVTELIELIDELQDDPRSAARALLDSARRRVTLHEADIARVHAMMDIQNGLHENGSAMVAGVDEVGRGALAGPLTAAAVVLDSSCYIADLNDSKRLTPDARVRIAEVIRQTALAYAVCHVDSRIIDTHGIVAANAQAMRDALDSLPLQVDHVIADGLGQDLGRPATFVVGGDRRCACVAAASILAKVERDALMRDLDSEYPGYDFAANKGYGTGDHMSAIVELGPSPVHRMSFSPCSQERLF